MSFTWKGKTLTTTGHIMDAVNEINSPEEARQFMSAYRKATPHADENIGYMSGYFSSEKMKQIQQWFEVSHPVFGYCRDVSPEEALAKGMAVAQGKK
jgi:hypothetical protein